MKPKKQERLSKRKNVFKLIKETPRKTKELENLVSFSRSTLKRILKELEALGIIEKRNQYWTFHGYRYPEEFTPQEYAIAIDHAKSLMSGLQPLLDTDPTELLEYRKHAQPYSFQIIETVPFSKSLIEQREKYRLSGYVEEHLKTGYPELYESLIWFRKFFGHYEELLTYVAPMLEQGKRKNKERGGNPMIPLLTEEEAKSYKALVLAKDSMLKNYQKLFDGIQQIRISVEVGKNPLEGQCRACPNIILKEK